VKIALSFFQMLVKDVEFNGVIIKTVKQEDTIDFPIDSKEYIEARAVCFIHPEDLKKLGVKEGNVRLKNDWGSVIVKLVESERETREGILGLPAGPWSYQLTGSKDDFIPELHFPVKAKTTEVDITSIKGLLGVK